MTARAARGSTFAGLCLSALLAAGCGQTSEPVQLLVAGGDVLDVRTGAVLEDRTVVVNDGRIREVLTPSSEPPEAIRVVRADGRLVIPGLVDAHSHFAYLLGDSLSTGGGFITRLSSHPDSVARYARRYAQGYLPYGVTSVRDAGSARADVELLVNWMQNPRPDLPEIYPTGGALVSPEEDRTPFPGHRVVHDPGEAAAAVRAYHQMGLRHVKLYWRLGEPEFRAALEEAKRLGMTATGHVDFHVMDIDRALDLGLRSFEHAYTVGVSALGEERYLDAWREHLPRSIGDRRRGRFYLGVMEYFNVLGRDNARMERLMARLAETDSFVVPTLHLFAEQLGLAPYESPPHGDFDDLSGLTPEQLEHARRGYRILADYVRRMYESGVPLAAGSDWVEPGKSTLSEIWLLHRAGIPMAAALRIATLGGAEALRIDDDVGTVEPGKKAHLVILDENPLENPAGIFGSKTVVKDGVVVGEASFDSADAAAIDSFVRAAMEELEVVPGLALAVVEDGRIVHEAGFGHRDREAGLPVTPRTVFYTASLAKAFTGATAAVLAAEGVLDLDAPLVRFFPELTTEPPVDADGTTLRDLLRHGKSFSNGAVNFVTTFVGPYDRSELVRVLNEHSDPSEGFAYSNEAYALAGYAIEAATGRDWRDVMHERVFGPLGMERSTARLSAIDSSDVARPYLARENGIQRIEFAKSDRTITGAGGIFSTAHDLARFVIAQLGDGRVDGRPALPAAAVREMQAPQIELERDFFEFERYAYGLGLYLARWEGEKLVHHFGGFPGFRSHLSFMPEHDIGVVVLQNEGVDGNRFADVVATYVYDRLLDRPDADARGIRRMRELRDAIEERRDQRRETRVGLERWTATPGMTTLPLEAYAGEYVNERLGTMRITAGTDRLHVEWGDIDAPVLPTDTERFLVPWVPGFPPWEFTFEKTENGAVQQLQWDFRTFVRRP